MGTVGWQHPPADHATHKAMWMKRRVAQHQECSCPHPIPSLASHIACLVRYAPSHDSTPVLLSCNAWLRNAERESKCICLKGGYLLQPGLRWGTHHPCGADKVDAIAAEGTVAEAASPPTHRHASVPTATNQAMKRECIPA